MLARVNEHGAPDTRLLIFLKAFFLTHAILLILPALVQQLPGAS